MTLLTPFALIGLLLAPALIALHLRRRQAQTIEIPSLILWADMGMAPASAGKRRSLEQLLLLVLQLLATIALVVVLARPSSSGASMASRIYVIDDGMLMSAADPAPSRLQAAETLVARDIQSTPSGTSITVIAAGAVPRVLIATTDGAVAIRALHSMSPVPAAPDFEAAIGLAAALLPSSNARLKIVSAAGEALPPITAAPGVLSRTTIGHDTDDQAVTGLAVRCAVASATCDAFATIQNGASTDVQDTVVIDTDGRVLGAKPLALPALSSTNLSFSVPTTPGVLQVTLTRPDLVGVDNIAYAVVPAPARTTVTVIGTTKVAAVVGKALSVVPGVHVVMLPTSRYGFVSRGTAGLLVLAGWVPQGPLPPAPSLLVVDPPRFPGAPQPTTLADTAVSGEDMASPLLSGVDLTSLDIAPDSAAQLDLPTDLQPVVWTTSGPLISTGTLDGRRVAVLSFNPSASNIGQLPAYPLLTANLVQWSNAWLPQTAVPGAAPALDVPPATGSVTVLERPTPGAKGTASRLSISSAHAYLDVSSPGIYTVTEKGSWGSRGADLVVNSALPSPVLPAPAIAVNPPAGVPMLRSGTGNLLVWPWLGLVAALFIAAEWLVLLYRSTIRYAVN